MRGWFDKCRPLKQKQNGAVNMTKEKKEFSWDTQTRIGGYGDAKERHEVFICTLNGKTYIQDTKEVKTAKGEWKRAKGATMPLDNFKSLQEVFSKHELADAFGDSAKEKGGKTVIHLPGTHQAKMKAAEAGAKKPLKAIKSSFEAKLAKNGNFGLLPKAKQAEAIKQVTARHDEDGMVSIGISKSNFHIISGKGQMEAERDIKQTKGFSRAAVSFFA